MFGQNLGKDLIEKSTKYQGICVWSGSFGKDLKSQEIWKVIAQAVLESNLILFKEKECIFLEK